MVTGIAAILVLGLAVWLLLGRSPRPDRLVEAALGKPVRTDAGTVTVFAVSVDPPGLAGAPAPEPGHVLLAIRFRSCRSVQNGPVVELSLFFVRTTAGPQTPNGSRVTTTPDCAAGFVFVQAPDRSDPDEVVYRADPVAAWQFGS